MKKIIASILFAALAALLVSGCTTDSDKSAVCSSHRAGWRPLHHNGTTHQHFEATDR